MREGSNTRVVIVFPGALGDVVLALPTFCALRARHAAAHLTLVVAGWLVSLVATAGVADVVASLDDADAAGLFGGARVPRWLEGKPRLYSWIGGRDPDVRARLAALAERVDVMSVVRGGGAEHAAAAYAHMVGMPAPERPFRWPPLAASALVPSVVTGRPLLAVHAGAGSAAKRWWPRGFVEIVRRWQAAGGRAVELVGPADEDVPPLGAAHRATQWPLPDVAALLARAEAYCGNDSGITHLAGAVGARGVAVFGPTSPHRWAPYRAAIDAVAVTGPFGDGIARDVATLDRVWEALRRRGCLDKVRDRE